MRPGEMLRCRRPACGLGVLCLGAGAAEEVAVVSCGAGVALVCRPPDGGREPEVDRCRARAAA